MAPEHENAFDLREPIPMVRVLAQRPSGDDYAYPFRSFRKRMHLNLNPNRPYLFFRILRPL